MKIALMSDIHDNIWKLKNALTLASGAEVLLFLGDFCAPFTLKQMIEGFAGEIHVVWGNNDGDKWLLTQVAGEGGKVTLHGDFGELDVGGVRIAMTHYPHIARPLATSGAYGLVAYGHDHKARLEHLGQTLLLNPGEIMGRFGRSTFALYDSQTAIAEIMEVP